MESPLVREIQDPEFPDRVIYRIVCSDCQRTIWGMTEKQATSNYRNHRSSQKHEYNAFLKKKKE